jgi:predicted ATP-grasp superfamily ATP-dependent carboligase
VTSERFERRDADGELCVPKRIFVSEYVCGGGWSEETLEPSLAREGRAMLLAVAADLLRVSGCEVVTTWDKRLGAFPRETCLEDFAAGEDRLSAAWRLEIHELDSADEATRFRELCAGSDAALVIAPEFHGILARRTEVAAHETALLGSDVEAIELCSDKLRLAEFLLEREIPSIPTTTLEPGTPEPNWPFPIVMKPRDGAGSLETFLIENREQLESRCRRAVECSEQARAKGHPTFDFIQQPFVPGEPLSAAVIQGPDGDRRFLPVCRQSLSDDGCFRYLGSDWNSALTSLWQAKCEQLTSRILGEIPGLAGYVGFDLIGGPDASLEIAEINPRLTTGYLAWRKRSSGNLAANMMKLSAGKIYMDK